MTQWGERVIVSIVIKSIKGTFSQKRENNTIQLWVRNILNCKLSLDLQNVEPFSAIFKLKKATKAKFVKNRQKNLKKSQEILKKR